MPKKSTKTAKDLIVSWSQITGFFILFLIVLIFGIKGLIDVIANHHYFTLNYLSMLIRYSLGSIGFFAILGIIDYFRKR